MARALEALVVEAAVASLADHRLRRHGDGGIGFACPHSGDDLRRVGDRALRQVAHLGTRIGEDLLAHAVIELLRHLQGPGSGPAEAGTAQLLQRGQVVKPRRALALVLHPHAERTREVPRRLHNRLGIFALQDAVLRRMPHPECAAPGIGGGRDLEVGDRNEVADLQLALARDRKRRGLHPPHPDHALRATAERDRRGAGQRQVVDLVGLTARDGGGVETGMLGVGPGAVEGLANGLRVLRGEHHPHHLAAVAAMLQDLLANELSLAVAVSREPDPLRRA